MNISDMQSVKLVNKGLQTGKPEYLRNKLVFIHQINVRNTRQDVSLHLSKTSESGKRAFILWTSQIQCFVT